MPAYGDSPFDVARQISVLPEHASAWVGRPGLEGSRNGRHWSAAFRQATTVVEQDPDHTQRVVSDACDPVAGLALQLRIELSPIGTAPAGRDADQSR